MQEMKRYVVRDLDGTYLSSHNTADEAVKEAVFVDGTWEDSTGEWEKKHIKQPEEANKS